VGDSVVCAAVLRTLQQASGQTLVTGSLSTMEELIQSIPALRNGQKFLFHFDEVGIFESLAGAETARKMLQCIWGAAEMLRNRGHFFVLSGRSSFLHLVGKQFNRLDGFESPNATVLIPLHNLSAPSIEALFMEKTETEWIRRDGYLEAIRILTGGIPRAVASAADYVKMNPEATPTADGLERHVQNSCPQLLHRFHDTKFRHLVEIGWAGIEVNTDVLCEGEEPLSAMLARFGLYTSAGSQSDLRRIEVPLYLLRTQRWAPASLKNVVHYNETGDRLETGFRRVLFLRLSVLDVQSWDGISLGYLGTTGVPFPAIPGDEVMTIFNLPKMSRSAKGDAESAKDFMDLAHQVIDAKCLFDPARTSPSRQTFHPDWLKQISELMRFGHMYIPLPRSSSADAMMRLGDKIKLDWQFKNFIDPISLDSMKQEAELCSISGWTVYLVIFCSKGHCANDDGSDFVFKHKGVQVIALSRESVYRAAHLPSNESIKAPEKTRTC